MERLVAIKERLSNFRHEWEASRGCCDMEDFSDDVAWLIAEVARLTKIVEQARDKSQILASNCAAQKDRGGNVQAAYAFEKSQQIYEILRDSISKE